MPWQFPQTFPTIRDGQIHIWRAPLKRNKEEFAKLLNQQEKDRADKFIVEHAKNNFIVARGALKLLITKYLGIKNQDLLFKQNKYGKLYIKYSRLQFNISHSHDFALFIFALDHQVGIDIEFIRDDFDFIPIAQRFFSKKEFIDLVALPKEHQIRAFFNCWSRKEAFIKAIGKGIFFALDKFSVEVSNKTENKVHLQIEGDEFKANDWSLEALSPADGYTGAFATSCKKYETSFYSTF